MVDSVGAAAGANTAPAAQLSVAGTKTALDVQKQEGESVLNLLETSVGSAKGSSGNIVDVTA
ncbi:MAG: hypothetical protein ACE5ER_08405 [Nitrospinaceae bacterium]